MFCKYAKSYKRHNKCYNQLVLKLIQMFAENYFMNLLFLLNWHFICKVSARKNIFLLEPKYVTYIKLYRDLYDTCTLVKSWDSRKGLTLHCPKGYHYSAIHHEMQRGKQDTSRNISCRILFFSTYHVILRKFGLIFGQ